LVIGARGHSGIAGILLGSVADYITRHATVPVVVVPPENRTTAK
jgi:nucleotide-binding universal stress UspA family protein